MGAHYKIFSIWGVFHGFNPSLWLLDLGDKGVKVLVAEDVHVSKIVGDSDVLVDRAVDKRASLLVRRMGAES